MPFVKLDCKMPNKSIWREDSDTRIVWITLLLMADQFGIVESSIMGISDTAKVSIELTKSALVKFELPDEYSTNPANEGRRIERIKEGYRILNYEEYRQRDFTNATRQKRYREKHSNGHNALRNAPYASASDKNTNTLSSKRGRNIPPKIEEIREYISQNRYSVDPEKWFNFYESKGWMIGKNRMVDWKAAIRTWAREDRIVGGSLNVGRNDAVASEPTLAEKIQHKRALIENFEANYKLNPERWGPPLEKLKAELKELEDEQKITDNPAL